MGLGTGVGGLAGLSGGALLAYLLAKYKGIQSEKDLHRLITGGAFLGSGVGAGVGAGLGGYGGYRVSKSIAEDTAGEKGLPWGKKKENEEEAKEASARGKLSSVLLKKAMKAASI